MMLDVCMNNTMISRCLERGPFHFNGWIIWLQHPLSASNDAQVPRWYQWIDFQGFSRGTYQKLWMLPDVTMKYRGFLDSAHSPISEMISDTDGFGIIIWWYANPALYRVWLAIAIPVKCHEQLAALSSQASGICVVLKQSEDCRMVLRVPVSIAQQSLQSQFPAAPVVRTPFGRAGCRTSRVARLFSLSISSMISFKGYPPLSAFLGMASCHKWWSSWVQAAWLGR